MALYFRAGLGLRIYTNNSTTAKMVVTSAGNVGIGSTNPGKTLDVYGDIRASNSGKFYGDGSQLTGISGSISGLTTNYVSKAASASTLTNSVIYDDGTNVGIGTTDPKAPLNLASGATWSRVNAGDTAFTASSSRTIKENIKPFTVANILGRVEAVPVVTCDFKPQYCQEKEGCKDRLGLIAEDFHTVLERGSSRQLRGGDIQMALWLAVQELAKENRDLKARVEELEKKAAK